MSHNIVSSPDPLTGSGDGDHPDSPQLSLKKRLFSHGQRQRYSSKMSTLSEISERESSPAAAAPGGGGGGRAAADNTVARVAAVPQHEVLKRPSLLDVLFGSHLSVYVNEGKLILSSCKLSYMYILLHDERARPSIVLFLYMYEPKLLDFVHEELKKQSRSTILILKSD